VISRFCGATALMTGVLGAMWRGTSRLPTVASLPDALRHVIDAAVMLMSIEESRIAEIELQIGIVLLKLTLALLQLVISWMVATIGKVSVNYEFARLCHGFWVWLGARGPAKTLT
jgi:hypothetical protein